MNASQSIKKSSKKKRKNNCEEEKKLQVGGFKRLKKTSAKKSNSFDSDEKSAAVTSNLRKKSKCKTFDQKAEPLKKHEETVMNQDVDSDLSEEDQNIRNELKNTSIYKNIKKLLTKHPSLCNSFDDVLINEEDSLDDQAEKSVVSSNDNQLNKSSVLNQNTSHKDDDENYTKTASKKSFVSNPEKNRKDFIFSKNSEIGFMRTTKSESAILTNNEAKPRKLATPRNKAREKLQAAKFRFLNEKLYTESGKESFAYFQKNKDEFMDYHTGYSLQVSKWPMNPVDKIISSLQKINKKIVIADMGCGDAKIARTLSHTVHSFDLVALNEYVTPCNISKVPLPNESVDVVIFCLSLMGTNLKDYLQEAYRIMKIGGYLKIAEVESRIPNIDLFIKSVQSIGFMIQTKDVEHKLFVFLDFKKEKGRKKKKDKKNTDSIKAQDIVLKPCLYKKR